MCFHIVIFVLLMLGEIFLFLAKDRPTTILKNSYYTCNRLSHRRVFIICIGLCKFIKRNNPNIVFLSELSCINLHCSVSILCFKK